MLRSALSLGKLLLCLRARVIRRDAVTARLRSAILPCAGWLGALLLAPALVAQTGTALVRHAPSLNGTVDGSIQQLAAESVTLNGGATISLDLFVPGTPTVVLNG